MEIVYLLHGVDGRTHRFEVRLDPHTLEQTQAPPAALPSWVALDTEQCAGCPLRVEEVPQCPAARSLATLLPEAGQLVSFTDVDAEVHGAGRVVRATIPIQNAMSSLIGLCMATSGCPHLAFLKPMARFHVPFASMEETVFRATSSYLLGQYFRHMRTGEEDFTLTGLEAAYRRLHQVNVGIARRLRHVSEGDANLNATVKLDMFTHELPYVIGEELAGLAPCFQDYWQGGELEED